MTDPESLACPRLCRVMPSHSARLVLASRVRIFTFSARPALVLSLWREASIDTPLACPRLQPLEGFSTPSACLFDTPSACLFDTPSACLFNTPSACPRLPSFSPLPISARRAPCLLPYPSLPPYPSLLPYPSLAAYPGLGPSLYQSRIWPQSRVSTRRASVSVFPQGGRLSPCPGRHLDTGLG